MELVLIIGAIVIAALVFLWLVRIVKATIKTALLVALIVFGLQFLGIGPDRVIQQVVQIGQYLWQFVPGQR
jgi:hypothetical protein